MSEAAASPVPSSSARALYVYYRVRVGYRMQARLAIETMQANLRPLQAGLHTRLMCRVEASVDDAQETWMEVYEHPDGVSPACEAMLKKLAATLPVECFAGQRHIEIFAPLP